MRKTIAFLLITCIMLCGCSSGGHNSEVLPQRTSGEKGEQPVKGGVLRLAMQNPDTLNPILTKQRGNLYIYSLIFDSLITLKEDFTPEPCLAESWSIGEGSISFKLRRGVLWHDGREFGAEDVVASFNLIKSSDSYFSARLKNVINAQAPDSSTVVFKLSRNDVNAAVAFDFPIIPRHIPDLNSAPVGTGQFAFSGSVPGKKIVLRANPNWFGGRPYIDGIEVLLVSSPELAVSSFNANIINALTSNAIDLANFSARPSSRICKYPSNRLEFIGFNCEKEIFASAEVRKRISDNIKRSVIVSDSYTGFAVETDVPINPQHPMYVNSALAPDRTNFNMLSFELLVNEENTSRMHAAELIRQSLAEKGASVTIKSLPTEQYMLLLQEGKFDAFLGGSDIAVDLNLDFLLASYGELNRFGYRNPQMDEALSNIKNAANQTELRAACLRFQSLFRQEYPIVPICFLSDAVAVNACIGGNISPGIGKPYRNIHEWFIIP